MEEFKNKLRTRVGISIAVIIILGAFVILNASGWLTPLAGGTEWRDFWQGMIIGFSAGAQIAFLLYAVRTVVTLTSPERLKARYIADNDERTQLIAAKAGANSYWFEIVGLLLGVLVGGYFSLAVSLTCLCVGIFIVFLRLSLTLYYKKKF